MRIIGLTGGTGSGKSAAARRFEEHGIPVVDADRVGHEIIDPGGVAEQAVIEAFGEAILTDGSIDRAKLGPIVFGDPARLRQLNVIVHPAMFGEIARRCQAYAAQGKHTVIVDAALLAESGERDPWLAGLILVVAPEDTRVKRLSEGRGIAPEETRRRMQAQTDPESKRAAADWVIDNSGDLDALHRQVDAIAEAIQSHAD